MKWTIGKRLTGAYGTLVVITLVLGGLAVNTLSHLQVNGPLYKRIVQGKDLVGDILPPPEYILEPYLVVFQLAAEKSKEEQDALVKRLDALHKDYIERHEFWSKDLEAGEVRKALAENSYSPAIEFFKVVDEEFIPAVRKGDFETAQKLTHGVLKEKYDAQRSAIDKVVELTNARNEQDEADAAKSIRIRTSILFTLEAIGVILAILLAIFITRGINKSLKQIANELGAGADQTADAAGQVASSSESLAQGASEQASSIEETSASIEEMSSMTKANAENAAKAKDMATSAMKSAEKGSESMTMMNKAIADIKKSSDSTAKIVKTIDEIAFQTNLLALNAAVEAARAGESGKGFAVVAEEVRSLAKRSAEAAKNTAELIEESVRNANNGVEISKKTAESLHEISAAAKQVNELLGEIATASSQQTQGISQIGTATSEMEKVTQSNAASAEESASASEELSVQAEEMKRLVRDLLVLVGGAGANAETNGDSVEPSVRIRSESIQSQKQNFYAQNKGTHPSVVAKNALKSGKRDIAAQQVIPLDDDDFKQF